MEKGPLWLIYLYIRIKRRWFSIAFLWKSMKSHEVTISPIRYIFHGKLASFKPPWFGGGHPQQRRKASKGPMAPGRSASHPVCSNGPLLAPSDPSWATNRATRGTQAWWSLVETWVYLAEVCKRLLGSIPRKCWFEWENIMEIYDIYIYRAEFLQDFNLWRHWNDGLYIGKTPMMVK